MRPELLPLLVSVGAPSVHPDSSHALVATRRPHFEADAYTGQIWRVDLAGGAPRRVTRGFADGAPAFSPDGRSFAFLRATAGGRPQVFIAPAGGGEAAQATDANLGVSEFCWSPDSARLAYVARVPAEGRYGTLDGVGAEAEDPRHITGYQFQSNGLGWSSDRVAQLFVVEAPDPGAEPPVRPVGRAARDRAEDALAWDVPPARQLTDGDHDVAEPVFTPGGDAVLVTSNRGDGADDRLRTAIHRVCVASGEVRAVVSDPVLSFSAARPSGDGRWLFVLGMDLGADGLDFVATNAALYVVAPDGGSPARLTDPATTELHGPLAPSGEDAVLVLRAHHGSSEVLRVDAAGTTRRLWGGSPTVTALAAVPGSDAVVAACQSADSPGEVALLRDGSCDLLTDFAGPLRDAAPVHRPHERWVRADADADPVQGWVFLPEGPGPHPVVLAIHGGPYAHYGPDWFDEFQVLAAAGYGVVACNPRGSASYGEQHGARIRGDFGRLDLADVLAFLDDALAAHPELDSDRLGIMGGSYGGYLTAWTIAHDHRFAAAIVERGFLDPASFLGASDIGWFFMPAYNGVDRADQDRQSPTLLADRVRTPTLVIHSEQDLRCPLSQALRYYTALRQAGTDAELLVFPGENHELSRSGTPWHRRQRFEAILAWWGRHLPLGERRG